MWRCIGCWEQIDCLSAGSATSANKAVTKGLWSKCFILKVFSACCGLHPSVSLKPSHSASSERLHLLPPSLQSDFLISSSLIKNPSLLDQAGLKMSLACVCEAEGKSSVMPQTALEMFHQQHQHHQSAIASVQVNKISLLNPLKRPPLLPSLPLSLSKRLMLLLRLICRFYPPWQPSLTWRHRACYRPRSDRQTAWYLSTRRRPIDRDPTIPKICCRIISLVLTLTRGLSLHSLFCDETWVRPLL